MPLQCAEQKVRGWCSLGGGHPWVCSSLGIRDGGRLCHSRRIFFPHLCLGLQNRVPEGPCFTHVCVSLWGLSLQVSPSHKAPLKQERGSLGYKTESTASRMWRGIMVLYSNFFSLVVGGCNNPGLTLFISGFSCHSLSPSRLHPESKQALLLTSCPFAHL